jgi:4'-phosphopantetheinyl transferase
MPFTQEKIHLKESEIHLLHYESFHSIDYLDQLTDDEKERYFTFKHEDRKQEFVATRVLRHRIFGFEHIHYNELGAPYIKDEGFISISHTKGTIGIAFCKNFQIGLDLEQISSKAVRIAPKFLNEKEKEWLDMYSDEMMTKAWSAKETLYKIAGRKKIDFKKELHLLPSQNNFCIGSIKNDGTTQSAEIHIFVQNNLVVSINKTPLKHEGRQEAF